MVGECGVVRMVRVVRVVRMCVCCVSVGGWMMVCACDGEGVTMISLNLLASYYHLQSTSDTASQSYAWEKHSGLYIVRVLV